ncbi:Nucleolar GTP-binding 2 [Paramuricea clavata]|uniref:Nucleolar GTP-binding protein 2 n=1 Tax=Paramuricea clavata TaxID=317549 RepID=A0A7D9HA51_PARCT|nr:Nucleolar GTP-binding 2 [Paramuricea clavata]
MAKTSKRKAKMNEKNKEKSRGSSTNPDTHSKKDGGQNARSKNIVSRLNMYRDEGKPTRNRHGKIVKAAAFQSRATPGEVARVEPNRKWFGNTRVITQNALQTFQTEMGRVMKDPYKMIMKQSKLPLSLLHDKTKTSRVHLLDTESFSTTFGPKAQRKRPAIIAADLEALVTHVQDSAGSYDSNKDQDLTKNEPDSKSLALESVFSKGQSKRIWNELYKVIDSSDVLLQVLDARDPQGTRCLQVEKYLSKEKSHKHLLFVLNKCDLVPTWVTQHWVTILSSEYPTLAFHASLTNPFGKGALINMLRQFSKLHSDKKNISIGCIGYPNVGKSSIINTLRSKKVCNVAPIAGETKVWQYVTLMRRIYLIDCPGVVYPSGDSPTDIVLKGVVRVENVENPSDYIEAVLSRVKKEYLEKTYKLSSWSDATDFLEKLAAKSGKLLKGGEADINTVAKMVLNDFQRGKLPYFVSPPSQGTSEKDKKEKTTRIPALEESFVKSSTHSSSLDIASPAHDISHDHHNLKDDSGDVTTNSDDVRINMTDDVTNINIDDVSGSESLIVMDNDDVTANKPDDVMSDLSNKTDDVMSDFANKTDDVMSDFSNKSDDVMKNIDDVTDDEIELEDKADNCNNALATDSADRPTFKVKQDLRKIRTTVEFVVEDVRGIESDEGDLINSEGEEEKRNWKLDESNGDDDNIDNSIDDDIDSDIDDNICNDGDHDDNICDDDDDIGDYIDYIDDNDSEIEVNWKQALKDDATVVPFQKKKLSKGKRNKIKVVGELKGEVIKTPSKEFVFKESSEIYIVEAVDTKKGLKKQKHKQRKRKSLEEECDNVIPKKKQKSTRKMKTGVHYYAEVNVKNKNRNKKSSSTNQRSSKGKKRRS